MCAAIVSTEDQETIQPSRNGQPEASPTGKPRLFVVRVPPPDPPGAEPYEEPDDQEPTGVQRFRLLTPRDSALFLLDAGFSPTVLYPPGSFRPKKTTPEDGKGPIGNDWGKERITIRQINDRFRRHPRAGVGLCLGPGKGPGGQWLADIEGDGPEAEDSRSKLFGGEVRATPGWPSTRGNHELYYVGQPDRLRAIMPALLKLAEVDGPDKGRGVLYGANLGLPGLELRIGGDGKQVQSACPPTANAVGVPRQWNGVEAIADLPDAFYAFLERVAADAEATAGKVKAEPRGRANGKGARDPFRQTATGSQDAVAAYLRAAVDGEVANVASAQVGARHNALRDASWAIARLRWCDDLDWSAARKALEAAGWDIGLPADEVAELLAGADARTDEVRPAKLVELIEERDRPRGKTARDEQPVVSPATGPTAVKDAASKARRPKGDCPYRVDGGCLVWLTEVQGEPTVVRLSNFDARIVRQIDRHEHGRVTRQFEILATRSDGAQATARVDAADYEAMGWVAAQLGAEWTIAAGRGSKDHARAAIQLLSLKDGIERMTVYTSTGWVEHADRPLYLHAGGAIGADGASKAVAVEINPALGAYVLPDPPDDPETIRQAIRATFRLLEFAASSKRTNSAGVAAILATLAWRAVLGPSDFSVHFSGGTGTRKTSTARLLHQHFAAGLGRDDRLPVVWNATAGSLQRYAYDCKDSLLIVDELTGERAVATATEFFQSQGNLKSRDRMDKTFRLAPSLDPRCSVLSTGEADPTRQSALGRMLTVRFAPDTIDLDVLTQCQQDAGAGLYAIAMAAFVRGVASGTRLQEIRTAHRAAVEQITVAIRKEVEGKEVHARHPGVVAELTSAYRIYLRFAADSGAIGDWEIDEYAETVQQNLLALTLDQCEDQRRTNPAQRFLALLRSGLASKQYHLVDANSDNAPIPYAFACGWHKDWLYQGSEDGQMPDWKIPANSKLVGFIDLAEEVIYLDPESAKTVATSVAKGQGEKFENVTSIGRDLADAGLIQTQQVGGKSRHTLEKRIPNNGKKRYFFLPVNHLFDSNDDDPATGGV